MQGNPNNGISRNCAGQKGMAGIFNSFTFKVIIDIYIPIAIFSIVFVDVFHSLCFLSTEVPFVFVIILVCW